MRKRDLLRKRKITCVKLQYIHIDAPNSTKVCKKISEKKNEPKKEAEWREKKISREKIVYRNGPF